MSSTLIIGGLFALGLTALIALIFVAQGESRPRPGGIDRVSVRVKKKAEHKAKPSLDHPADAPVSQTLPLTQQQWFTATDGQIHELSVEIKSLHQQAQEIEQRLSIVTEIVDRIESTDQKRATHIEEERSPHTS